MKIYSPDIVSSVKHQDTKQGASTQVVLHDHTNKSILDQFSIAEDGSLQFGGTDVGAALDNADVVSKLGVSNGLLTFNGQPVDTVGQTFLNAAILEKFTVVDGVLMFDGQPVDTTSQQFANVDVLNQLNVDAQGSLTFNGGTVCSAGAAPLHSSVSATFTLDPSAQAVIPHVLVQDSSKVEYVVEALSAADAQSKPDRNLVDSVATSLTVDTTSMASSYVRLSSTYGTPTGPITAGAVPVSMNYSFAYVVDSTIYLVNCATRIIYSATTANPSTFTATGKTYPGVDELWQGTGSGVLRAGDKLYYFAQTYIYTANVSDPSVWTSTGYTNPGMCGAVFIIDQKVWIVGGSVSPKAIRSADLSNLGNWTVSASVFPQSNGFNQGSNYQYLGNLYTICSCGTGLSLGSEIYRASADDPTVWVRIGYFPHADWRMGIAAVVNGAVVCASGYYAPGSGYSSQTEAFIASASSPITWTALTSMPTATHGAAKFVLGSKVYIVDGASLISYTVPPSVPITSTGSIVFKPLDLADVNPILDVFVHADIPTNTSVVAAISLDDGVTWMSWLPASLAWVEAPSMDAAFQNGAALSLVTSPSKFRVPGLNNYDAGSAATLTLALRLTATASNVTPCIYSISYMYAGSLVIVPMVTGGLSSSKAEIGLRYASGAIDSVTLKNLTTSPLTLRLKVQS